MEEFVLKNKLSDIAFNCECAMYDAVDSVKYAVNKSKKIILHPKLDATFKIKSKDNQNELFSSRLYFNKEISLFKIIAVIFGTIAAVTLLFSFMNSICKSSCCTCDDKCSIDMDKK